MADPTADNEVAAELVGLGVIDPESVEPFFPRTRDRDDISVWRCTRSGVIFLSRSDHIHEYFYSDKQHPELHLLGDRDRVVVVHREDTERRTSTVGHLVTNKRWLDVGTGAGGILDALRDRTVGVVAVEPQAEFRIELQQRGYDVYPRLADVPAEAVDVVTAFHVLEHFTEPLNELRQACRVLAEGGVIVVEVPHSRDALIDIYGCEAFLAHTFWSEHLVLHTRTSLRVLLEVAGFTDIVIQGVQRYPVANHLYWLAMGSPGGHERWGVMRSKALEQSYMAALARLDANDTLVATATKMRSD